jgi:D-glycero-D-manno-heptose 1,7-bisphosphate phosphatase
LNSLSRLRPGAFLDRDGTLIREREYLADPAGVELLPGVPEALRRLRAAGYVLVVVTNQSGIARGLYSLNDYHAVAERVNEVLGREDALPDATYFCPHHPDLTGPCSCRKPATGMYLEAAEALGIDLEASIYVGDRIKDVLPGLKLGGRGFLVRTGYGLEEEDGLPEGTGIADTLIDLVQDLVPSP